MSWLNRRDFLRNSAIGAGALTVSSRLAIAAGPESGPFRGTEIVPLGKTGLQVSRLALGTGFNGYNHSSELTRKGKQAFDRVLRRALERGITFLDMADLYGSHSMAADIIKDLPRDRLTLLSKIWPEPSKWVTPSGGAKNEVQRFCKELGVERLDACLIHCMTSHTWPEKFERIRDELSDLKRKGDVGAVGVSCHDLGALKVAASHPWVDVIFGRINNKGGKKYSCDAEVEIVSDVLKTARANGKAVVGMKIFGAGKLVKPDEKDASLKYVFANDLVDAITVGALNTQEVDDTLERMDRVMRGKAAA